jgi:hypothetical protein
MYWSYRPTHRLQSRQCLERIGFRIYFGISGALGGDRTHHAADAEVGRVELAICSHILDQLTRFNTAQELQCGLTSFSCAWLLEIGM